MDDKESDIRYTSNELFNLLKELTNINWKRAFDATPINPNENYLNLKWNYKNIYLNPPFSKARIFVKKLLDEMDSNEKIKNALIILPWYHVENYKHRVTSGSKWYKVLRRRMSKYNVDRIHLGNQLFITPEGNEIYVRVYAFFLRR